MEISIQLLATSILILTWNTIQNQSFSVAVILPPTNLIVGTIALIKDTWGPLHAGYQRGKVYVSKMSMQQWRVQLESIEYRNYNITTCVDGEIAKKLFNGSVNKWSECRYEFHWSNWFRGALPIFNFNADIQRAELIHYIWLIFPAIMFCKLIFHHISRVTNWIIWKDCWKLKYFIASRPKDVQSGKCYPRMQKNRMEINV